MQWAGSARGPGCRPTTTGSGQTCARALPPGRPTACPPAVRARVARPPVGLLGQRRGEDRPVQPVHLRGRVDGPHPGPAGEAAQRIRRRADHRRVDAGARRPVRRRLRRRGRAPLVVQPRSSAAGGRRGGGGAGPVVGGLPLSLRAATSAIPATTSSGTRSAGDPDDLGLPAGQRHPGEHRRAPDLAEHRRQPLRGQVRRERDTARTSAGGRAGRGGQPGQLVGGGAQVARRSGRRRTPTTATSATVPSPTERSTAQAAVPRPARRRAGPRPRRAAPPRSAPTVARRAQGPGDRRQQPLVSRRSRCRPRTGGPLARPLSRAGSPARASRSSG